MLETRLETVKKQLDQLSAIHMKCRIPKENISVGTQTLTDDEVHMYVRS